MFAFTLIALALTSLASLTLAAEPTLAEPALYQGTGVTGVGACRPGYFPEHLIGGQSQVTPGMPNRIRSAPSIYDSIGIPIGTIPGYGVVTVIEGPVCADGYAWWKINYEGTVGWTADGDPYGTRWLERLPGTFGSYQGAGCPNGLPTRLVAGQPARVTPGLPNALRDKPGKNNAISTVVSTLPGGTIFDVIGGPFCADGYRWWAVSADNGMVGWTAEGEGGSYWLEPLVGMPALPGCPARTYDPMWIGRVGYVSPNAPAVNVYAQPVTTSPLYLSLPRGSRFVTVAGPVCGGGARWWEVQDLTTYITGWLMEGDAAQGWLVNSPTEFPRYERTGCPANLPPRLTVGANARVTPGDPNTLRDQPGTRANANAILQIPGGTAFTVLGGPFCTENRRYWAVSYLGIIGWTAEGEGLTYWLAP